MISGIDHVVVAVEDLERGIAAYEALLGRACGLRMESDGVASALIALDNIAVELMAPTGIGDGAARLRAALAEDGEGLKSIVFATVDIERAHRRAERVGLAPGPLQERAHAGMRWRSFRVDTARTGVRIFLIAREAPLPAPAATPAGISALDHVVVRSNDMERAAALYGARLGLDMALDREVAGRRLMFFRCGDAVVEVAPSECGDHLWGLSWRVRDADGVRMRLRDAGLDVSEVRAGMKPGTRVFTVREGTCGVPTLMLQPSPKRD